MQQQSVVETVGSAVVGEAVSRIYSYLISRGEEEAAGDEAEQNEERMEVALLRIQAAVEEADGWHITNRPLVRWRDKLKRAADEGKRVLTEYKQRRRVDDDDARTLWLPRRVARAAGKKFFAFGSGGGDGQQLSGGTVRRFERLADGVGDFLKLVESGGRAKRFVPFQPVASSLLARRAASCSVNPPASPGATAHAFAFPDLTSPWRRPRAHVVFLYADGVTGEKLELFVELVLSESADVMALALASMDALPPHFRFASAAALGSFHRLQAQDMTHDGDDDCQHLPGWDAHYCRQPSRYEQPEWMASGHGNEPAEVAALPEHVLYVVAEWDSPAANGPRTPTPPVHVSYHLGRQGADSPVPREEMARRILDGGFGTRTRRVERYADAGADTFDGLVMQTVDCFRRGSGPATGQVVRWCFVSGWVVYLSVRGVGAGPPYEVIG
ncbi:hypothetical protein E2562_038740 [Oryza meyeriana var. granulata]|uniref:Rx N-terminal domain-containing protein n=1 Tax=Oryza meyeriana var. granulata TaxID=110450 RepID=A0A6G1CBZ0_9ORYZ|nr:hypothetical protein E2562_038740 [Oryza meyeriana var. granulata]